MNSPTGTVSTSSGAGRASLRIGLAGLRAHKRRFAGTFVAVFLGVAFLAGTMVMGDTLRASFGKLFADANSGTDTVVRGADEIAASGPGPGPGQGTREPVPTDLADAIRRVPGVAAVAPVIEGAGELVKADGKSLDTRGPTVAGNWIDEPGLNPYKLVEGHAPQAPGRSSSTGTRPSAAAWPSATARCCAPPTRCMSPSSAWPPSATRTARARPPTPA